MKTDEQRPRGRRTMLRGIGLALLALVAPGVASDAVAAPPSTDGWSVTRVDTAGATSDAIAAPDGQLWLSRYGGYARELFGLRDGTVVSSRELPILSYLTQTPLTDGTLGLIGARGTDWRRTALTVGAEGPPRERVMPGASTYGDVVAFAPDGAIWRGSSTAGLVRIAADGSVRRHRFRWQPSATDPFAAIAFGGDGSAWYASLCRGRIARVAVSGSSRVWTVPRTARACASAYDEWGQGNGRLTLVPTDDGGLSYGFSDGTAGRIGPRGKHVRAAGGLLPVLAPDGATWGMNGGTLWRRAAGGRITTMRDPDPRGITTAAIGPDGRLWLSRVTLTGWKTESELHRPSVTVADEGGARLLDGLLAVPERASDHPRMAVGPDGAMWIVDVGLVGAASYPTTGFARVVPSGVATSAPTARPRRVVARTGRALWLQLRCDAAPGRYCATKASLHRRGGGRALTNVVTATVPGGVSRTVRLTLNGAARAQLRAGRELRGAATAAVAGQVPARLAVTLRSARR